MCMRRVINEFVGDSLLRTHEPSIVEETDDFFLLLISYHSTQFSILTMQPSANTSSLCSLTTVIVPIVKTCFFSSETENSVVRKSSCDLLSNGVVQNCVTLK
jgi:hypothetical protein